MAIGLALGTVFASLAGAWIAPSASAFTFYLASGGATTGDQSVAASALIKAFKAEHPKADVELDVSTSYLRGVTETLMQNFGDRTPDVAIVGLDSWPILAKHKMLRKLSTVLSTAELDSIWKSLRPEVTAQSYGSVSEPRDSALPFNRGTPVLYINGSLLRATGRAGAPALTWTELLRDLETAQASQREFKPWIHLAIPLDDWVSEGLLVGATGTPTIVGTQSSFAAAPIKLLIGQLRQMRESGALTLVASQHEAYEQFLAGHAAAALFSASALGGILERATFAVRVLPMPTTAKRAVNAGGGDLILPDNPNRPMSAKNRSDIHAFIEWFYKGAGAAIWAARASMAPLTKAALNAPVFKAAVAAHPEQMRVLTNADKLTMTSFYKLAEYCGILKTRQAATRAFEDALTGAEGDAALDQADGFLGKLLANPDCP